MFSGSANQMIKVYNMEGMNLSTTRYHDGFMGQRIGPISCIAFHPHRVRLCAVLCCAVLCCAVLCCAVLCAKVGWAGLGYFAFPTFGCVTLFYKSTFLPSQVHLAAGSADTFISIYSTEKKR